MMDQEDLIGRKIYFVEVITGQTIAIHVFAVKATADAKADEIRAMGFEVDVTEEVIG